MASIKVLVVVLVSVLNSCGSSNWLETDECQSSPCQNGGSCVDGVGSYTCQCPQSNASVTEGTTVRTFLTGYSGTQCEIDIDECKIQPSICLNGGACENTAGSYFCKCGRGANGTYYTGDNCEKSLTYCDIHPEVVNDLPACKNNGTCQPLMAGYRCDCAPGFEGRRCMINTDECVSNPCKYNGTCADGINGYTCICTPGRGGINCDLNIDECASNPCLHGGVCIDQMNSFECNCTGTGFTGVICDIYVDDCESNSCQHGSTCVDGINGYTCVCIQGMSGVYCNINIDECASNPCLNGGWCIDHLNRFECNCSATKYTGETCGDCQPPLCVSGASFKLATISDYVFVMFSYVIFNKLSYFQAFC